MDTESDIEDDKITGQNNTPSSTTAVAAVTHAELQQQQQQQSGGSSSAMSVVVGQLKQVEGECVICRENDVTKGPLAWLAHLQVH